MRSLRTDLFAEEVYVFTPKGEVKVLPSGATPIDFAYAVHTDVGHRTVGAKVNGRIVPLHYRLRSGDFVEILTSKSGRGPSRDWLALVTSSRARNKIRQWYQRETRGETEAKGRELARPGAEGAEAAVPQAAGLERARAGDPRDRASRRPRTSTSRSAPGSSQPAQIVNKVIQRLKTDEVAAEPVVTTKPPRAQGGVERPRRHPRHRRRGRARAAREVLHAGARRRDRRLHLDGSRDHGAPRGLPERPRAPAEPGALHRRRVGGRRVGRASSSRSPSTPGIARACSRTSRGRSPSTAQTSSPTAASSRTAWRGTGTRPRSAT